MKFSAIAFLAVAATPAAAFGPATPLSVMPSTGSSSALSMVLEKPKKLSKLEVLKTQSRHLENPLREVRCFCAAVVFCWHCYFVCFGHFWFRRLFPARIRNCIATNANADQRRTTSQWLDDDDAVVVGLNVCVPLFGIEANRKFGTITCVPDFTNAPERTNDPHSPSARSSPSTLQLHCIRTEVIEVILSPSDRYMSTVRKAPSYKPVDILGVNSDRCFPFFGPSRSSYLSFVTGASL